VWALSAGRIPLVISVMQVLALDIGTDILPALALGAERSTPGTMSRAPRPRKAGLLDGRVLGRAFGYLGPIEAVLSMAMLPLGAALFFGWTLGTALPSGGVSLSVISTMVFASIALQQKAVAFECRSTDRSLFSMGPFSNRLLDVMIAIEAVLLLAFVYVPPIAHVLGQHPLSFAQWIPPLITPLFILLAEEGRKVVVRRRRRSYGTPTKR
jgi:magnesium-transporting ATPase (P-type)